MDIITLGLLVKIAFALSVADDLTDVKKKLWETTGEVAGAWLDRVLKRLPSSVRDAMRTAERQIKTHQTMLRLDESRQEVALTIAGHLLRDHAPGAADIVQAAYDADTLTTQILRDGHTILAEIDGMEGENDAVQAVLTILLRHVLTQTDSLQATESLWRKVMQDGQADILAELRRLPDDLFLRSLAGLTLLRPNAPLPFRKDILSASELLTARHTTLSLRGREGEMETLLTWATTNSPFGVRLLTGPGGHGKTRLALELCRRLEQQGWRTGFLLDRLPDLSNIRLADLFDDTRSTLITIDYAAGRMEDVRRFTELADEWGGRLRLLLVEREAGDWWANRQSLPDPAGALLRGPACIPDPMEVPPLPTGIPQTVFADAASHFAAVLGVSLDQVQTPGIWPDDLGLPLFARARALLAVEAARDSTRPPAATQDDILDHLLSREQRVWRAATRLTADDNAKLDDICNIVTLLTLAAPTHRNDAPALVRRLPALAHHSGEILNQWLTALRPLYGEDDLLRGLEPDLLGEHLVWRTVKSPTAPLLIAATGPDASEAQAQTALTVLNRLAARKPDAVAWLRAILDQNFDLLAVPAFQVALEQPLPIAALFREVMERLTFDHALTLADLLPDYTTELREIAAQVEQCLVNVPLPPDAPTEILSFRAQHLNNLSNRLFDLGQREEALAAVEEAVAIRRALAEARPEVFGPNLATALNTLSNRLAGLGKWDMALSAVEEAVTLYRALAGTWPDLFTPNLAMAMSSFSNRLSEVGQWEQALEAAEEAVDLYRTLAQEWPEAFTPDLAITLNSLSGCLIDLGRWEEAIVVVEEAVDLYRRLTALRPDAFKPNMAMSLNNLAIQLFEMENRERAVVTGKEAVNIYYALTETRPSAFMPDLAMALNNLSTYLSELGQLEQALKAGEEAVNIRRALAEAMPDAFRPVLASALNNLSTHLSRLGQRERALAAAEEAVTLYRALAETRPEAFLPDLARSIAVQRDRLREAERFNDALAAAREAVSLLFPHFRRLPAAFADRMLLFFQYYTQSAKEAGQEPDPALVDPIRAALIEHGFLPPADAEPDTPSAT